MPRVSAETINTDGNVAFEDDAVGVRMLRRFLKLNMQVVLDEKVQRNAVMRWRILGSEGCDFLCDIFAVLSK